MSILLKKFALKAIDKAFDSLFGALGVGIGGLFGGGGSSGSAGTLGGTGLPGFGGLYAAGGPVSGPGTGTSDSVPAMLSDGECVINAASTRRHRALLDAINAGSLPRFARGGAVIMPAAVNVALPRMPQAMPRLSSPVNAATRLCHEPIDGILESENL